MASYKLRFNPAVRDLYVLLAADANPTNTINAGTFEHTPGNPKTDQNIFYNYARDAMYKLGYQNMAAINIRLSASLVTYQIPVPVINRPNVRIVTQ